MLPSKNLRLVCTIGRKGEGPLEFANLTDVTTNAGFLYVLDGGSGRLSRLSMDGDTLATANVSVGSSGSIALTDTGTLLVSGVLRQSEGRVQEYDTDLKRLKTYFEIHSVQERYARSRGTSVALRVGITLILLSSHSPLVETIADSVYSEFDYSNAFCSMYPFFRSFLKMNDKLRKRSGGYVGLFCFGKGAQLGRFYLMPGPLYSMVALDTENLKIASINTGELSKELSRWGYGSFSAVVVFGESIYLSASSASVLVEVSMRQLDAMLENAEWHSPKLIKREVRTDATTR